MSTRFASLFAERLLLLGALVNPANQRHDGCECSRDPNIPRYSQDPGPKPAGSIQLIMVFISSRKEESSLFISWYLSRVFCGRNDKSNNACNFSVIQNLRTTNFGLTKNNLIPRALKPEGGHDNRGSSFYAKIFLYNMYIYFNLRNDYN